MPYTPTPWFHLGPLGRLVALPAPSTDIGMTLTKHAAQHVSLNASMSEDVQGYRREWSITMPYLEREDMGLLEAMFTGVIPGPLRLIDPTRRNRLSLAASVPGMRPEWNNGPTAVTVDGAIGGVVERSDNTADTPSVSYTAPDSRAVSYQPGRWVEWQTSGAYAHMALDTDTRVPVVGGEVLTLSAYVRTTGGKAAVGMTVMQASGFAETYLSRATEVPTWTRLTRGLPMPADAVDVRPFVQITDADATGTAATVGVSAVQLERGDEATTWVPGGGCPEVLITGLPATSPLYPLVNAELALREV